ncbi:MAG TPA: phospholipase D family protein [Stellaceae bacterium]|nr:phospholipase D family protein [Stellaceae bacterium]
MHGFWRATLAAASLSCLLVACVGRVEPVGPPHRIESHALPNPDTATRLGGFFAGAARAHPGLSGFDLVTSGRTAFEARYAFAHLAERTIDAQYFLWADDATGRNLLRALLDAADRGVRVRLLIDDLNRPGADIDLAALNAYPNIQVRLFNPFTAVDFVTDFARVNHRMHDKAFIVDNAIAVAGGRNIADQYFQVSDESNFRDLDLLAVGPIVREISDEFDEFWNSPWATSVRKVDGARPGPEEVKAAAARLRAEVASTPYPFKTVLSDADLERLVDTVPARLAWGKATLLFDAPNKPATEVPELADELRANVSGTLKREVLLEVAYFIPSEHGVERLCARVAQGVAIRILTNSLASTDEISAYAGYMHYRDQLLHCGVELHELRPDAAFVAREWTWLQTRSEAELHTKAAVFDRKKVMIGSFNLDPRSRYLNTEIAVLVESPELAAKVTQFIDRDMSLANSFRLELVDDDVVWVAEEGGREVRFRHAPVTSIWRRLKADLISVLPVEELL